MSGFTVVELLQIAAYVAMWLFIYSVLSLTVLMLACASFGPAYTDIRDRARTRRADRAEARHRITVGVR